MNDEATPRRDHLTRFQGTGVGVKHTTKPISVLLPSELDVIVRSLPNRSEWLREAISEKLIREGKIADPEVD